jgi:uncharacterized RDD family membrane protein YckC
MGPSYLRCKNGKSAQATADTAEKIAAIATTLSEHSICFAFLSAASAAIFAALAPAIAVFIPILASGARAQARCLGLPRRAGRQN